MKHLLNKNGTSKSPELEDDVRCEALLNSLANQQKQSSASENSSPPAKRQRFLGTNENNEVIIVDDQVSPSKPSSSVGKSSPVSVDKPGKVAATCSKTAASADSAVVDATASSKSLCRHYQSRSNAADVVDEVICIDDDDDDTVPVVNESTTAAGCTSASTRSDKTDKPQCSAASAQKPSRNVTRSLSAAKKSSTDSSNTDSGHASASANLCDTSDSKQFPSSSERITRSRLAATPSVDRRDTSADTSMHRSSSSLSRRVARLEDLLKVGWSVNDVYQCIGLNRLSCDFGTSCIA